MLGPPPAKGRFSPLSLPSLVDRVTGFKRRAGPSPVRVSGRFRARTVRELPGNALLIWAGQPRYGWYS